MKLSDDETLAIRSCWEPGPWQAESSIPGWFRRIEAPAVTIVQSYTPDVGREGGGGAAPGVLDGAAPRRRIGP